MPRTHIPFFARAAQLLGVLLLISPASAVVNGIPAPCNDRRFDAVGIFETAGAAPGPCGGAISGSCVLVAPDLIVIARHSLDIQPGQSLSTVGGIRYRARFRRSANGDSENSLYVNGSLCHGVYQEVFISRLVDCPNPSVDMVLAYLERPIMGIRPAPIELGPVKAGTPIILAGWGYAGECLNSGDHWSLRYARGQLPIDAGTSIFYYTPCGIGTSAPCLTCPPGGPWVEGNLHDSGAGIFIEVPSMIPGDTQPELRLIGHVNTTATAHRLNIWNDSQGQPAFVQTPPLFAGAISDFNRDGRINSDDLLGFLSAYMGNKCEADVGGLGQVNVSDLFNFVTAYYERR